MTFRWITLGAEFALRGVVGDVDLAGIIAKGQKLVSRAPDFGLQFPREVASGWRGQKRFELFFQFSFLPRERRGGEIGDGSGEVERLAKPKLEPEGQIIGAVLERESGVAGQMSKTGLMPLAMFLLRRIAVRYPDFRHMPVHYLVHDAGGAGIIRLMHDRVLAVENPGIRVRPLDPNAGLVAGDDLGGPNNGLRLLGLDLEAGMRADEHVHQRPLAHAQPERIAEQAAQPFIRQRLETLQIDRQRMDARSKRRRRRDRGSRRFRLDPATPASAGEATVADDIRLDRRDFDLVVFADQVLPGVRRESQAAPLANARHVIAKFVRIVRQPTVVRLMPEFRSARTRILALLLLVRRRRLGRRARSLVGPLEPQHQLDQLLFAQLLQITAVHRAMDSEIAPHGKGVGNCPIDVTRPRIDKAHVVRKLHETLGIAIADMIFVGDVIFSGGNDYPAKQSGHRVHQSARPV